MDLFALWRVELMSNHGLIGSLRSEVLLDLLFQL